ncbi:hypothetical protein FKW77_009985 [Venturia effusa]|uniref:Ubiquitin-like domain-containing protein n=1 Tax=Venturia effusa TaxID=50376 RepID=A0A517L8B1_9PEZI|nr:hypothetical protein FKW77_009985 [Venturia effusa]
MNFLFKPRSEAFKREHEEANTTTNDLQKAKEKIIVLETKLQHQENLSLKDIENIAHLKQKLTRRDDELSSERENTQTLVHKVQSLENHIRYSDSEIQKLKENLRRREEELQAAKQEAIEAKESTWKQNKVLLHTQDLLVQAEEDLVRSRIENDGKKLALLRVSNQAMRQELTDTKIRAELDLKAYKEETKIMSDMIRVMHREYEESKAELERYKKKTSTLETMKELREEKQKIVDANKIVIDRLQSELTAASMKLDREQIRCENMVAGAKALIYELSKQVEASSKESDLAETRLVQYGCDLRRRLDELSAVTKTKNGNSHSPSPEDVEVERKKLLGTLPPAPMDGNQRSELCSTTITTITELITTAFEMRRKYDGPGALCEECQVTNKTISKGRTKLNLFDVMSEALNTTETKPDRAGRGFLDPCPGPRIKSLFIRYEEGARRYVQQIPVDMKVDHFLNYVIEVLGIQVGKLDLYMTLGAKKLSTGPDSTLQDYKVQEWDTISIYNGFR